MNKANRLISNVNRLINDGNRLISVANRLVSMVCLQQTLSSKVSWNI